MGSIIVYALHNILQRQTLYVKIVSPSIFVIWIWQESDFILYYLKSILLFKYHRFYRNENQFFVQSQKSERKNEKNI